MRMGLRNKGVRAHSRAVPLPATPKVSPLAERVRATLLRRNMTQTQLSIVTHVNQSTLSLWLNGKYTPQKEELAAKVEDAMADWLDHGAEPGWTSSYQPSPNHPGTSRKRRRKGGKGRRHRSRPRGGSISTASGFSDASSEESFEGNGSDSTYSPAAHGGAGGHAVSSPVATRVSSLGAGAVAGTSLESFKPMAGTGQAKRARLDVDAVLGAASMRPHAGSPVERSGRVLPVQSARCALFDTSEAQLDTVAAAPEAEAPCGSSPRDGDAAASSRTTRASSAAAASAGAGGGEAAAAPQKRAYGRIWRKHRLSGPPALDYGFFGLSSSPLSGDDPCEGADYDFCAVLRAGVSLADPFPSARLLMPVTTSELNWTFSNHQFLWPGTVEAV